MCNYIYIYIHIMLLRDKKFQLKVSKAGFWQDDSITWLLAASFFFVGGGGGGGLAKKTNNAGGWRGEGCQKTKNKL